MNLSNFIGISGLTLVLFACGSEDGGPQAPPPVRGIEGTGVRNQGIQGSGFRTLGIQGTGRNANATKPRAIESSEGDAGASSTE